MKIMWEGWRSASLSSESRLCPPRESAPYFATEDEEGEEEGEEEARGGGQRERTKKGGIKEEKEKEKNLFYVQ